MKIRITRSALKIIIGNYGVYSDLVYENVHRVHICEAAPNKTIRIKWIYMRYEIKPECTLNKRKQLIWIEM